MLPSPQQHGTRSEETIMAIADTPAAALRQGGKTASQGNWPPPWFFVFMPVPFGVFSGYVQTALPWLLRHMGYSVDRIGAIVALILSPMAFAFLWSPLADFGLRRRTWMQIACALSGLLLGAGILLFAHQAPLAIGLLVAGYAVSLLSTSCGGGMLAVSQNGSNKAGAAAWMQGGMLTASALGGALLLYFSKHLNLGGLAGASALLVAVPAAFALAIPEPAPASGLGNFLKASATMGREIRSTLFSMESLAGLLLLFAPVGSGAAQNLFPAMAKDYGVSLQGVMLLNGVLGGVLNMLGAFVAVIVPAHWDRRIVYAAAGVACAASGAFLALAPLDPSSYFVGVAAYMFTTGICYGFFLGVVMQTMGDAGLSASTRYGILVALGDLPIVYMTVVEGWSYRVFGVRGVPAADCVANLLVGLCTAVWLALRLKSSPTSMKNKEYALENAPVAAD
jgi:MFS transporter, PAT family, beta-lactamase induction signal transducer AmpG